MIFLGEKGGDFNVIVKHAGYFTFINSVKVSVNGIPAAVSGLFFALIALNFTKSLKLKLAPLFLICLFE